MANTIPRHLGAEARALWQRLQADFVIADAAGTALLRCVCECFERISEMRTIVKRDGAIIKDRFGQSRPHPALAIERDARAGMISALRALRLSPDEIE